MSSGGAFVIQEDQPGLLLRLVWKGPRTSPIRHTEEIIFDGQAQTISLKSFFYFIPFAKRVISYKALRKIELWVQNGVPKGHLRLLLRLRYEASNKIELEEEIVCRVEGLDLLEEAKDLLFRIARTTEERASGADIFRASPKLEWGYFLEQEESQGTRLTLVREAQPYAKKVPWIEEAAQYSKPQPQTEKPPQTKPSPPPQSPNEEAPSTKGLYQRGFINPFDKLLWGVLMLLGWFPSLFKIDFNPGAKAEGPIFVFLFIFLSLLVFFLLAKISQSRRARRLLQRGFYRWRFGHREFFFGPEGILELPGCLHPLPPNWSCFVLPGRLTVRFSPYQGNKQLNSLTFPISEKIGEEITRRLTQVEFAAPPEKGWLAQDLPPLQEMPVVPRSKKVAAFIFSWEFLGLLFLLDTQVAFWGSGKRELLQSTLEPGSLTPTDEVSSVPQGPFRRYQPKLSVPLSLSDFEARVEVRSHNKLTTGALCLNASLDREGSLNSTNKWMTFWHQDSKPHSEPYQHEHQYDSFTFYTHERGSYTLRFTSLWWNRDEPPPPIEVKVVLDREYSLSLFYLIFMATVLSGGFFFFRKANEHKQEDQILGPGHVLWFLVASIIVGALLLRLLGIDAVERLSFSRTPPSSDAVPFCLTETASK